MIPFLRLIPKETTKMPQCPTCKILFPDQTYVPPHLRDGIKCRGLKKPVSQDRSKIHIHWANAVPA